MMNAKHIIKKHDNLHCINNNYALKYVPNDENKCINDMLSNISLCTVSIHPCSTCVVTTHATTYTPRSSNNQDVQKIQKKCTK